MSSISGIGNSASSYSMTMRSGMTNAQRPDPTKMAEKLFSKLDTSGQGYIQKSDLQSAIDKVSTSSTSSSSDTSSAVDSLFTQLDGNNDSKVTKQEFSDGLAKLAEQYNKQGMQNGGGMGGMSGPPGGMGGMSGPPGGMGGMSGPPGGGGTSGTDNAGLTKDQLTGIKSDIDSKNSAASSSISDLITNFDVADKNKDGKVSLQEAANYQQSSQSTSSSSSSGSELSVNTDTADTSTKIMSQIMKLMHAYGIGGESSQSGMTLSAVA
ncbi:conserved hypothetical protein [Gammaproteobacteria bacterium]